jgi:hypothetical protein
LRRKIAEKTRQGVACGVRQHKKINRKRHKSDVRVHIVEGEGVRSQPRFVQKRKTPTQETAQLHNHSVVIAVKSQSH